GKSHAFLVPSQRVPSSSWSYVVPERTVSSGRTTSRDVGVSQHRAVAVHGEGVTEEVDVVVIGSGIAGLCSAALLASYGKRVIVCESHYQAGGCAHGFERGGYKFDSGPHLFSGMSVSPTPNPLKHVLNAIGEDVEWLTY
ncbi:unnamed protein product, partial [Discosporangium mesarthrocarpum]